MRHFFVYTKKYFIQKKILPGDLVWWFSTGFIRVGAILDPFFDPFSSNTSSCAIESANFEVPFFTIGPFSIGSTIESEEFTIKIDPESQFRQVL